MLQLIAVEQAQLNLVNNTKQENSNTTTLNSRAHT